jgi:hypothetical protein
MPEKPTFGIAAVPDDNSEWPRPMLAWTAYWKKPTDEDFLALYQEYAEDEELGLVGVDIYLMELDQDFVEHLTEDWIYIDDSTR